MDYPKGSEWRKWDLQVQTILDDGYTSLSDYYKEIKDKDVARWNQYILKVGGEANALQFDSKGYFSDNGVDKKTRCTDYARNMFAFLEVYNPSLACIGITDHNYFDDTLLDVLINYSKKASCKIIPGVEINCNGVHMLLFFGNVLYGKSTFSAGLHTFLSKFNIDTPKKNGVYTVTSKDIKEILSEVHKRDGVVIYAHCANDNGLFKLGDKTLMADAFNHQATNLLQTQNADSFEGISDYIEKNTNLRSKHCLHISSDARSLRDIGRPDKSGNFLWVKANPTYDGLRQIVYEPEQRVHVGSQKPQDKKPYFLIDKVRFIDSTEDIKFGSDQIEINQNLTSIIGGKSTGKSLLLYYIAKTINKSEVDSRINTTGLPIHYGLEDTPGFNFEVLWKDGQTTLLKSTLPPGTSAPKERKILYIPQRYLNTLSETKIESRDALNAFILNVILQDAEVKAKHEDVLGQINFAAQSIPTKVSELFAEAEEIKKIEEELRQVGDEQGIAIYIQTLKTQIEEIKASSGLNEAELKKYEELTIKEKELSTKTSNLSEDKKTIKSLRAQLVSKFGDISALVVEHGGYLNDLDLAQRLKKVEEVVDTFGPTAEQAVSAVLSELEKTEATLCEDLTAVKALIAPFISKVKAQADLKNKTDALHAEEQKLNESAIKKNAVKTKLAAYTKKAEGVLAIYAQIVGKYDALANDFKTFESKFGDIALAVNIAFKNEQFNSQVIDGCINKRNLKKCVSTVDFGEEFRYEYDPVKHIGVIGEMFTGLTSGSISTIKGHAAKEAVVKLFEDYFFLDFKIFYRGDSLEKMSPGKKGLVLLRLLVNLSNEEWPILLDQPEDDLDNRSVYEDLVQFIKERKRKRQILIVTHNPNLVVGADSEEVVVANQEGQERGRENKKFKFEYISDAIEDSFELDKKHEPAILYQKGIRQHVCEILEGGKEAFKKREQKYNFPTIER